MENTSNLTSRPGNAVDVLSAAIERVVDQKFHRLESILSRLENLSVRDKKESAAGGGAVVDGEDKKGKRDEVKDGEKAKDGEKSKEKDKDEKVKDKDKDKGDKDKGEKEKDKDKGDKKEKKKKEKMPLKTVAVAYKVNCVSDISAVSCTFVVDMKVFFHWTDEKLIGRKSGSNVDYENEKGLFDPDIVITNEHELHIESNTTKIVDSDTGEVKRTVSYKGTVFLLSMNLKSFPFDCQNLQICFKPYKLPIESVIMVAKPPTECAMDHPVIHEWDVLGHCIKTFQTDPGSSSTGKVYSTLFVTVLSRRKYGWFITNVFIPTAAFLLIAWLTFAYGPENRGERNDVSMATLLASIANKYVVCDQIPKVDYRTLLDRYVDLCFALQVLTLLASAVVYDLHTWPIIGPWVNTSFFLLEVVSAYLFHEWMYSRLYNHEIDIHQWVEASRLSNQLHAGEDAEKQAREEAKEGHGAGAFVTLDPHNLHRRESYLYHLFKKYLSGMVDDVDDGSGDPSERPDAEHFSSFGASIVTASLMNQEKKKELNSNIQQQQQNAAQENFKHIAAKSNLRAAFLTNDADLILDAACRIVQATWRMRVARKVVTSLKVEKDRLVMESAAKKIQKIFRYRRALRLNAAAPPVVPVIVAAKC